MLYLISGHGGSDPGAFGNGKNEADVTRQISSCMKRLGGSQVVELDKSIDWYAENRVNADLKRLVGDNPVLEIHLDSSPSSEPHGGHVIIKEGYAPDAYDTRLAEFLHEFFPGRSDVIVARRNLANVNRAAAYRINYRLVECCFITNAADMQKLNSHMDEFCTSVLECFDIYPTSEETKLLNIQIPDGPYPVYRAYNSSTSAHLFTSSKREYESLDSKWTHEGIAWTGADTGQIVYRIFNPNAKQYHFTLSHDEAQNLVRAGWIAETVNMASARNGKDVFRLYNPNNGDHFFTVNESEKNSLVKLGWKFEGVAFKAI